MIRRTFAADTRHAAPARSGRWYALLVLLLLVSAVIGVGFGAVGITPAQIFGLLTSRLGLPTVAFDGVQDYVLFTIRIPRVLFAGLIGASLALSGAALQGLYRNPLADPGLIGVSSGAALAAAFVIAGLGQFAGSSFAFVVPLAAFAGGLLTTALVYGLSIRNGRVSTTRMLLTGIAVNALAAAGVGIIVWGSTDAGLRSITFWRLGSLGAATWTTLGLIAPFALLALLMLPRHAGRLNLLSLGEREAGLLGVNVPRLQLEVIVLSAFAVAASVAFTGLIGFVGLIAPHLMRLLLGSDHRRLLPASALFGASLLIVADTVARTVSAPAELPIGVITALIGAPVFLLILRRGQS